MKHPGHNLRTKAATLILAVFPLLPCFAGLKFEESRVVLKAGPGDEEVVGEFAFKNTSNADVGIAKIESSCGCLSATADKRIYAPGEEGVVKGVFKLGKFTGVQEKTLKVFATGKEPQQHRLLVNVTIPDVFVIEPDLLEWKVNEEPDTKSFVIKVPHSDPIRIRTIKPSRQNFQYELVTKEEGREYEIRLTPESTEEAMLGVLRIETDCVIPKHQRQMAFFSITKPRPKRAGVRPKTASN